MSDNAHGCETDAVSIRRNAFWAIFTSIKIIFLNLKKIKNVTTSVFVISYLSNKSEITLICWV